MSPLSSSAELSMFEIFHEIKHFSTKIKEYKQTSTYIDKDIVNELINSIKVINTLLDDPIVVQLNGENEYLYKGINVNSDLIYRCQTCKTDIGPYRRLSEHILLPKHIKESQKPIVAAPVPAALQATTTRPAAPLVNGDSNKKRSSSLGGSMKNLTITEAIPSTPAGNNTNNNNLNLSTSTQSLRDHIRTAPISVPSNQKISVVKAVATGSKNDNKKKADTQADKKTMEASKICRDNLNKATKALLEGDIVKVTDVLVQTGLNLKYAKSYEVIVRDLNARFHSTKYVAAKSYCFGSRINGLGTKKGDLDIYVDVGNTYQGQTKLTKQQMGELVDLTAKILSQNRVVWNDFEKVKAARTPILRTFNHQEKIDCDISFTNGLSHCNTYLLQYFLSLQPVCHKLAAFIKQWSVATQLNVNSYVFTLLVIFYLQNQKILPAVYDLQKEVEPFEISCWQSNFADKTLEQLKIERNDDFPKHLLGFFEFYGNLFMADKFIVCPLLGLGVEKKMFQHGCESDLDNKFVRYKKYMSQINVSNADKIDDLFAHDKPLVIQDPLELIHNVSKGVTLSNLTKLRHYCRLSVEVLKKRNFK